MFTARYGLGIYIQCRRLTACSVAKNGVGDSLSRIGWSTQLDGEHSSFPVNM